MKNKYLILLLGILVIGTSGCGKSGEKEDLIPPIVVEEIEESDYDDNAGEKEGTDETNEDSREKIVKEDSAVEKEDAAKAVGAQKAEEGIDTASQTDPEKAAYNAVLEKLYTTYTLPDGTELGYDGITDLSWNKFAIYDIDQDGKEELIIQWTTTYTAGMSGIIYGFDSVSGTVKAELWEYPSQTFYDNGVVEVELSHNHGMAGEIEDFWPYTFYQYDKNTDTYLCTAEVDAWNKAYYETDYDGVPFPDELDADKDGILYQVTVGNSEKLMDLEEYEKWRDSMIGGAVKIEIPFVGITEESIRNS
ncbi:MAG: hypothetical protein NC429_00705 [Lachnospiraceae bacterium]|nr:hypothetical protein [Lachnospiraceae bacterium]